MVLFAHLGCVCVCVCVCVQMAHLGVVLCVCVYTYHSFEYMYVSIYIHIRMPSYGLCGMDSQVLGSIKQTIFFSLALMSCIATCKRLYRRDGRRAEILLSFLKNKIK